MITSFIKIKMEFLTIMKVTFLPVHFMQVISMPAEYSGTLKRLLRQIERKDAECTCSRTTNLGRDRRNHLSIMSRPWLKSALIIAFFPGPYLLHLIWRCGVHYLMPSYSDVITRVGVLVRIVSI